MSTLVVTTVRDRVSSSEADALTIVQAVPRAWLNVTHGTPINNDSFGISSLTDLAAGRTNAAFTNAFVNDDYVVAGAGAGALVCGYTAVLTTDLELRLYNSSFTLTDNTGGYSFQGELA